MVMRTSAFAKNSWREIRRTLGRYIAILAIIALGVGFFSGLRVMRQAMVRTGDDYLRKQRFYDFRMLSTMGFTQRDADAVSGEEGVAFAEGSVSGDFLIENEEGKETAWKALMISELNAPALKAGRMPVRADEVLADHLAFTEEDIGRKITVPEEDGGPLLFREYTISGLCSSPLYLSVERGTTSLGNGKLAGFFCFRPEGLDTEIFTELYVAMEETAEIFSEEYDRQREQERPLLEAALERRAEKRFQEILTEAEEAYADAEEEYLEGKRSYEEERKNAEEELDEALKKLEDSKRELDDAGAELDSTAVRLADAEEEIRRGEKQYYDGCAAMKAAREEYETKKTQTEEELAGKRQELAEARAQAESAAETLEAAGAEEILRQYAELQQTASALELQMQQPELDEQSRTAAAAQLEQVRAALGQIEASGVPEAWQAAQSALEQTETAQKALDAAEAEAQNAFAEAEKQLKDTEEQLYAGWMKVSAAKRELEAGKEAYARGLTEYQDGKESYEQGLEDYEQAKKDVADQFAEAEEELSEAERELADAREEIDSLQPPETWLLDRDSNAGYLAYDNDSQIVQGISRVFPLFFFLVAALVCVTTMTRMVDDQRTQIGTLKALGFSNARITWKYVFYSGSAALIGAVAGFLAGSALFPVCIWKGYSLLYGFGRIRIVYNWGLGAAALVVALLCSAGATYAACRKELHSVPAELMRPRTPPAGKRVWIERIGFLWRRFSFLHKVTARNIFRYKKRLIMMVLGIGGCTALVITGLGLRDSICDIAEDQFGKIMTYDYSITFREDVSEEDRKTFGETAGNRLSVCVPVCSDTVEGEGNGRTKQVNVLACSNPEISSLVHLKTDDGELPWPEDGSVIISNNLAEVLGLAEGDMLRLKTDDVHTTEVPVTGIFRNYVYYYAVMTDATYEAILGRQVKINAAYADAGDGDVHAVAASLSGEESVAAISVMADLRTMVGNMLKSMNYIVALVIGCAAALAFVVLFNLSNINISERVREIATIEVLGFSERETAAYVFRENLVLTLMGAVLGLPLGKLLHAFVMDQIRLDMVCFETKVTPLSYVIAVILTFVFTVTVDLIMRRKLRRIDMAEALKSVE